ncbi:substrate-binding domain-containing protein [Paenibacillus solisilvae]|uniref:Substrate-binding domain-containing protein n=1 Tax=Paenibacillus solisilvae TaxID=2486751 RepID=A0ABW0W2S8_9BACL
MSSEQSYTTEEIAKLLKISKLTVYDLIKKGELPSYRVGKQMRVDASDLENYKLRSKGITASAAEKPVSPSLQSHEPFKQLDPAHTQERQIVITGQDISLDILAKHIEKQLPGIRPLRSYVGSMDSLISMYRGESDLVSTHLLDGDTGDYNVPYIRKLFISQSVIVVRLLSRSAGLYTAKGNPLKLGEWADLTKPNLRIINREKGSGARVLLDEQLRLNRIKPSSLTGYADEQNSHLAVAAKVANGEADVGVGIENAARFVDSIDYIPLIQEQYDLVMLKRPDNLPWIHGVISILQSKAFQQELESLHGYDLKQTGQILYET